jgi:hypothetical protein
MRRLALTAALLLSALPAFAAARALERGPERGHAQAACHEACRAPASRRVAVPDAARPQYRPQPAAAGPGTPVSAVRPVPAGFAVPRAGYGVIFATRTPGAGHGMVVAETDRLAAFRIAELRCSRGGPGCRLIAEFSATCGAVAHGGRRSPDDTVSSIHGGAGPDREEAEADALAECRSRDPGANCRIVAAQCGNRNG